MADAADLLPGTLDMLVLKSVSLGKLHGYGVLLRIQQITKGALQVQQGALYPALYRLEQQALIESEWGTSDNNRRAKFYRLTKAGEREFAQQSTGWLRLSGAAAGVVFTQPVLDTQLLTMAIGGDWLDRSLDGIAQRLGVTVRGRHTALGDALTTAELLVRMIPLLAAAGVSTLDDALEVCRRQVRLAPGAIVAAARARESGP